MAASPKIPEAFRRFIQPFYVDAFGSMPPVPAERLSLNPDCGFAPSGTNPIPLDEAYAKLKALGQAAQQLRGESASS